MCPRPANKYGRTKPNQPILSRRKSMNPQTPSSRDRQARQSPWREPCFGCFRQFQSALGAPAARMWVVAWNWVDGFLPTPARSWTIRRLRWCQRCSYSSALCTNSPAAYSHRAVRPSHRHWFRWCCFSSQARGKCSAEQSHTPDCSRPSRRGGGCLLRSG